jgi:hypothetical protein
MKSSWSLSLPFVLALAILAAPRLAAARAIDAIQPAHSSTLAQARQEASLMVPAAADLKYAIDARKVHPGDRIEASLRDTVHLKNGPELPKGTLLLGRITADTMQQGNSRLALRFTQAQLKNGQTVPIHATILQVEPRTSNLSMAYSHEDNLANETGLWNGHTLRVDQIGALRNVDMHSHIGGANSAVFVSHKDHNMQLRQSSQFLIVIAKRS